MIKETALLAVSFFCLIIAFQLIHFCERQITPLTRLEVAEAQ
jgi:hypothetical protein